jgi:hypothetical protein
MEKMALATQGPVETVIRVEKETGDRMFATFVSRIVSMGVDPVTRAMHFNNAAHYMFGSQEMIDPTIDIDPVAQEAELLAQQAQLLEYLDGVGAGPEAHVAAAFASYYETVPSENVIGDMIPGETVEILER